MNGFRKAAVLTLIFISTATIADDSSKSKIYSTKMGCMACHQGGSMQSDSMLIDKDLKKNKYSKNKKHPQ